jgi:hypothetical protein
MKDAKVRSFSKLQKGEFLHVEENQGQSPVAVMQHFRHPIAHWLRA